MSRVKDQMRKTITSHAIKIDGEWVNIAFARLVYRCADCHGELKRRDAGLVCISDPTHRRFIHQRDVEAIETKQAKRMAEVESAYEIKDSKIVARGDN